MCIRDRRIEGKHTLRGQRYIFERAKEDEQLPEDHPEPSPQVIDLEPGTDRPKPAFKGNFKDLEMPREIDLDNPPEDPKVGKVLAKIHARLRDKAELVKLHLKHYHMKTKNFKRRTATLKCPEDIYRLYDEVVGECPACQKHQPAPERSRITGMRATEFGHLWFIDHVDITHKGYAYVVLVILDAASNLLIVHKTTRKNLPQ